MGIVARQSIKGTLATYLGVAVGIFTTFFVQTKLLTTEEVGLMDLLLQTAILLSGLAQLGTCTSAMRYYPAFKDENSKDHGFFGWTLLVPLVGFMLFLALFFAFRNPVVAYFSKKSALFVDYIYFVIPLAFFMLYISVFETNSNLLMRVVVPRFIREVGLRVMALVIYVLYGYRIISLTGMVIAFCASYGIATIVNIIYLFTLQRVSFKIEKGFITPKLKRDFLIYTVFLVASALAGNITPLLNRFFVSGKEGLAMGGIFAIAIYIATLVEMPYRSLGSIAKPQISQAMADNNIAEADRICKSVSLHQYLVGAFIFLIIWINIDLIYGLMPNGNVYQAGKWVVFILCFSRLINSTLSVGVTVLSYSKIYYYSLFFTILLTVLAWYLNRELIQVWGMNGAALATLFAYVVHYSFLLLLIKLKIGTLPLERKHITVTLLVAVLFGLDFVWRNTVATPFIALFGESEIGNIAIGPLVDGLVKTCVIVPLGLVAVYKLKISQSVNDLIDKAMSMVVRKK